MYRDHTKVIKIGNRVIGGGNPILIQSMTNTKTEDVEATVAQILSLEKAGCDIIRCAVPTMEAAKALSQIKKQIHIPLVADIHFDYRLAIAAMENGADKIRINPGNIGSKERIQAVVDTAKERNIPIRVVVNNGIVFVDYANQLRLAGMEKQEALVETGRTRMRPILMTMLTTVLAMCTMVFSTDAAAEMSRGMAIVVIGGLLYATLMTLFVVPVLYDILFRREVKKVEIGDEELLDEK